MNSKLGMVDWKEGSLALDDMAKFGYLGHKVVLVKVILLMGIACWRADLVGSSRGWA